MNELIRVTQIRSYPAPKHLRDEGLRCFCNVEIDGRFQVDGLAVRRTHAGAHVVTWPERRDGQRRPHPIVTILDVEARALIEQEVLDAARKGGWIH